MEKSTTTSSSPPRKYVPTGYAIHFWPEYAAWVQRTASRTPKIDVFQLGVLGESGEVADLVKKFIRGSHEWDEVRLKEELGDVVWYCAAITLCMINSAATPEKEKEWISAARSLEVSPLKTEVETPEHRQSVAVALCKNLVSSSLGLSNNLSLGNVEKVLQAVSNFECVLTTTGDPTPEGEEPLRFGESFLGLLAEANLRKLAKRFPDHFAPGAEGKSPWAKFNP